MSYQLTEKDKEWIAYLRANPTKQAGLFLGTVRDGEFISGCCLGARHWLHDTNSSRFAHPVDKEIPAIHNITSCGNQFALVNDYKAYNLIDAGGKLNEPVTINEKEYISLAAMNDGGIGWTEIADYMEQNPDNVFTTWDTN